MREATNGDVLSKSLPPVTLYQMGEDVFQRDAVQWIIGLRRGHVYSANFTRILFLSMSVPLSLAMAALPSCASAISTKPKPLDFPVFSSITRSQLRILPCALNNLARSFSVKLRGRFNAISFMDVYSQSKGVR